MTEVHLSGDIDLVVRDAVHEQVDAAARAAADDGGVLVIDLGDVTFLDSSGLTCIAHAVRVLGMQGVVLRRAPRRVRVVLELAGFRELCEDPALDEPGGR